MSQNTTQNPPEGMEPRDDYEHFELFKAVKKAIYSLPSSFKSSLNIHGVLATDLFAFNSSLGATIEQQVVDALNGLRSVWDQNQKYALYQFERQPQTFPDVVLKTRAPDVKPYILMGIELKGWYILAKEREPSFRYKVTPAVCAPSDLLVVVPWALENVISGSPIVFKPFMMGARHAAQYRNWYWECKRKGSSVRTIRISDAAQYYPAKSDMISDRPESDGGGNFGRLARSGVMENYITELFTEKLAGIQLSAWQQFLSIFTESASQQDIEDALIKISEHTSSSISEAELHKRLADKFREIATLLDPA